jgi:hypothetical protein
LTVQVEFEFFAGVSLLLIVGAAWAHLAVMLDRLQRSSHHHGRCLKRVRLRLAAVERWLPKRDRVP